jgi:[protein-PII] uridylyltransferase
MRATNESLWNSWKANLLSDLYFNTASAFRHGLAKPVETRSKIRENQQESLNLLSEMGVDRAEVDALWSEFRIDYFLRYAPDQIARHSDNIIKHDREKPLVLISPKPYRGGTEVFIFTKEKVNTFASTVSFLGSKKLSIHDAKIITTKTGYTVNTFIVLDGRGKALNERYYTKELSQDLIDKLNADNYCDMPLQKLSKRVKQFKVPLRVSFIKLHTKNRTMIEIIALDRPGLLSNIAQVFQQEKISIHSAKITTFGEKVDDVFTISTLDNTALTEAEQNHLADKLIEEIE